MKDRKKVDDDPIKKIFFITSNQAKLDKMLAYEIPKNKGLANLKAGGKSVFFEERKYNGEKFLTRINSVEIVPKELKKEDKDENTKKYKGLVSLKFNRNTYEGLFLYFAQRHNFIYDFEFAEYKGLVRNYPPPPRIPFSKLEQLKLFLKYMKGTLKKKQKDKIYKDLISDSQLQFFGKRVNLDFYLEIFKNCYSEKEIKMYLNLFSLDKINLTENFQYKEYSSILKIIENSPDIIIQHCSQMDDKNKYYIKFYTLLLFIRFNYDKEKAIEMISKKELWKFYIQFLPENSTFFPKLVLSDELIQKMLEQELNYRKIIGILRFCGSIEKILVLINEKIDIISNCCVKENKKILMTELENPKKNDDIEKISAEIEKIIIYEAEKDKTFISFSEEFWKNYVHFVDDIQKLFLINKLIILCSKIEKSLAKNNLKINEKIHKTGLDCINNGKLKNDELLDFINIDLCFTDRNNANKKDRPLYIVKALDFDTMTEQFLERWKSSSIFKIYSFCDNDFKIEILKQVEDMKHFGKLLKLFNYKDKNIFDYNLSMKLREKFKNIVKTYTVETCPNFKEDVAYYIYIMDQNKYDIKKFLEGTIETHIQSVENKTEIYSYLVTNYKNISENAINCITDILTKNKERLNAESILFLFRKVSSKKNVIQSLLDKIETFVVKENELFNPEKEIESFKLLKGILETKLLELFMELNKPKYLMNTLKVKDIVVKKIEQGEINYDDYRNIYINPEKRQIFQDKLTILLFNNKEDVNKYMNILRTQFNNIIQEIGYINKIKPILKKFFENEKKIEIKKVEELDLKIRKGKMNVIQKDETKKQIEEMKNMLPDIERLNLYINSIFFVQLLELNKKNYKLTITESEILKRTIEENFNKLKILFEDQLWNNKIPETIIKECFKALKNQKKDVLKAELNRLLKIFEMNDKFTDLQLDMLENAIKTYNQKEDIFATANSCLNFIEELEAEKTQFSNELDKIRNNLKINIAIDKIEKFGKTLEGYGLKVLNPTNEDREYLDILQSVYSKKGSVKFISNLNDDDIRKLQELVTISDDTFVTNNDIQDMIKCSNFIHSFGEIKGKKSDKELIEAFIKAVPQHKGIAAHFKNYSEHAGEIRELFSKELDKSQATKQLIQDIMRYSTFILALDNTQESYLKFEGTFFNKEKPDVAKKINFEGIIELRERAMLTRKLGDENSEEEKKISELYKQFSERVSEIDKIEQLLKKIGAKGYSENIKIAIDIKENQPVFYIDNEPNAIDYEKCSKVLDEIYRRINDIQTKYYKNEEIIRFIYGRQFNLLNASLRKQKNNALAPFLKFLTNDQIDSNEKLVNLDYDYDYYLDKDKYICLFENIKKYLLNFLNKNNLRLEAIYKQNIIKQKYENEFKGLYTYLLEDDKIGEVQKGIEEHILNWYNFLTDNPPMAQTVLLCNEETTSEEITAFMYRAFLCEYHVFFMMGKIELLTSEKRQTLTKLINTLFANKKGQMKSCLAFAYSDKSDSIVQYLERIKGHEYLKHDDKKKEQQKLYELNVEIYSSDKAGVGKSKQINLKVEQKKKNYIHFPFGGEFNRKDVTKRLQKIQNQIKKDDNTVIHLDLYDTKQTELMKDFLYSILITKLYGQNENLFYLSKKVEIIVEIPCGFGDFFSKFPLLSMFKNKNIMSIENLPPLIIQKEIDSNIQIVCNYLKLLNSGKLSEKDLIINGVSLSRQDLESNETPIDAVSLSQEECQSLILNLIKKELKIEFPNYYQINSFVDVLSGQLKKFSMIVFLSASSLVEIGNALNKPECKQLREIMVRSFIKNTIHFTQGAFDKLLSSQIETFQVKLDQGHYDENKQEEVAIKALSSPGEIISCDKIDPSLVFFHEGEGQEFSIITKDDPNMEEYNKLLQLRRVPVIIENAQLGKNQEVPKELKHYTKFKHQQFLEEIKNILSLKNPVFTSDKIKDANDVDKNNLKSIEEIVGEYVFTADNFIKMILILLRIRENIPVIMMGETGCGKTSLIRKLSELINNGESKMEILNIHAGITDDEIVNFIFEEKIVDDVVIESIEKKAIKLEEQEKKIQELYKKKDQKYFKKKLWVFLDEINTCNCMGLICEMMTKHTCQGRKIPDNIFFIGACNPYRYGKKTADYALKLENVKEKDLIYTVNPLPFSLLNFVFNFGNLTAKDEASYIDNMIIKPIENFFWKEIELKNQDKKDFVRKNLEKYLNKEEYEQCEELKRLSSKSIIDAQNFVRERNDVSSVSLREIRRFSIFYEFFVGYFRNNKKLFENIDQKENYEKIDPFYKNLENIDIYRHSIKLSIYLCYYMRLSNKKDRQDLASIMNKIFGENFEEIAQREQQFISNNIEMKIGIAKNKALLENLFTLFVCVNSKVPLFIVGKPGCSKSLSVQLLFNAMKGEASNNSLFKSLPKLFLNSFQGSLGSTSKGVLNIFKKARLLIKNNPELNLISAVYFDEMGLAEHSPNNPLKVIHSELEYDLNEGSKKIAFIGISNWRLDASKMNRGLFLSIPKPDLEDLQVTARTIAESYNEQLAKENVDLFDALAITYDKYKNTLHEKYIIKEEHHGSRDFYHLIKIAMRQIISLKEKDVSINIDEHLKESIGINSIERNFAGLEFNKGNEGSTTSLEIIKKIFKEKFVNCEIQKNYDVLKIICENIKDSESRYLLLISKSSISNYLLNSILTSDEFKEDVNKELSFYIGSGFKKDIHSEGYGLKILNKIQLQMEQNKILLLSDLEAVYPSLYDLFNQNFTVVSKKNYARIAMGSTNNTFSLVNDGFKCIVLVDEQTIEKEEAPFLNRFEKHIISFEYLLKDDFKDEAAKIYNMIQDFVNHNLEINFNLKNLLINVDKEEIQGIIYSKIKEYQKEKKNLRVQELEDLVLEKVALTLPQDILLLLKNSGFEQKYPKRADKIIEFYQRGEHNNLSNFLKKMKNLKNVIYTFTSIDEPLLLNVSEKIETEIIGRIDKNINIKEIQISSLSTENELETELENIYLGEGNRIKIVVFKFNPYETYLMNYIKFFIENHIKEKNYVDENNKKVYIFSVHMNRIFKEDEMDPKKKKYIRKNKLKETISHLSDFYQIFIDNLNGEDMSIFDIMKLKKNELFEKCLNLKKEFMKSIYDTFSYFNYNFAFDIKGIDKNTYPTYVMELLEKNKELGDMLIKNVLIKQTSKCDIGEILKKKNYFTRDDVSIISVIQRYLSQLFNDNLTRFIFKLEKDNFFSSFIFNENENKNKLNDNEIAKKEKKEEKKNNEEVEEEIINNNKDDNENKDENEIKNYYLNNEMVKILIETYLENAPMPQTKVNKKIKNNKVSLLLGLKLPGIYIPLKDIIKYIKNEVKNKYKKAERDIIDLNVNNENEEEDNFGKDLQKYKNNLKGYQKNTELEILKNVVFEKLNNLDNEYQKYSHEFYELVMNDYYLIYLSEYLPGINDYYKNIDEYINILKLMLYYRFKAGDEAEEIDQIRALGMKMLWMEAYSQFIATLLSTYKKISAKYKIIYGEETNLFLKLDKLIKDGEIKFEENEEVNPLHSRVYKSPFYYISEALLRVSVDLDLFNSENEKDNKLKGQEFYDYLNLLKTITKDALIINEDLVIPSKEIFTIQEFLAIEEGLNKVNKSNVEQLLIALRLLKDFSMIDTQSLDQNERGEVLSNIFNQLYDFLFNNLGDSEKFRELIMDIFGREIKKEKNDIYRQTLLGKILNNKNLIVQSYNFMFIIMNEFLRVYPTEIRENIKNFQQHPSALLELINNSNNDALNEILLSIFENKINTYFEWIPRLNQEELEDFYPKYYNSKDDNNKYNETYMLFDLSLDIFKDCANLLEEIFNNKKEGKKEEIKNQLICELYSIAYIKMYLYKCIYYSHNNNQQFGDIEEIVKAICGNAPNNVRLMLKIYCFKIFFYLLDKNYQDFSKYGYKGHQISFFDELKGRFDENKEALLSFYMLPNTDENNFKKFREGFDKFDNYKFADFVKPVKDYVDYIINNGLDNFYIISTDSIVSNLGLANFIKDSNIYAKYSSYVMGVFGDPQLKLPEITKKLFMLYSNIETFKTTKTKFTDEQNLKEINVNQFEILLYSLRFCLQTTNCDNPNDFLYSSLITPECETRLKEICVPGNNVLDNIYVQSYHSLEKHLITENRPWNEGAYVCGCGLYYDIGPCGFPSVPGKCANCLRNIGSGPLPPGITGGHEFAHDNKGHLRIFKDKAQHDYAMSKYGDNDRNIPNMLINVYKEKVIDKILDKDKFGISKVSKIVFQNQRQKVRKLSSVGYRLLNFIAYSHLFYANCLGFIKNEKMNEYLCDGMTCIQMIEMDWKLLSEALLAKGIQRIQIFMNLIFDEFSKKLKECKKFKDLQEREKFEDEIEKFLEESYKKYEAYYPIYTKNNEELLQLDKNSMKSLVLETNDINTYDENEYPWYKYFLMTTYPTKENFTNELKKVDGYERTYPLLANFLNDDFPGKFLVKYLPEFNEFSNFMIDYYSYKISREEASNRILKEEDLYINDNHKFKQKLKTFIKNWDKLKPYATKYGCRDDMKPCNLDEKQPVAYFLNDNGEIGKGMYIAAAYENFIEWQNHFLDSIIETSKQNGILHHYVKNIEKTLDIQNAKKNEALNFDAARKDFIKIIYENTKRNIFGIDNNINYTNYQQLIYDFASIEKDLGEMILPGKVKFNNYEKLKFVTYNFEGFRGNKSNVLIDFSEKYKQEPLSLENKQTIYDIIIENYNDANKEGVSKILFSLQLLIYYLTIERQNENDKLSDIVGKLPDYVILSKECIEFIEKFEKVNVNIKFEHLIEIYSFFEFLCFDLIVKNLQDHYKQPISEDIQKKIIGLFDEKKFVLITKNNLASACRKFISRYLVSTRMDTDYDEKRDLYADLKRYEFWGKDIIDNFELLEKELDNFKDLQLKVGQCYKLYELLEGEENDELKGIKLKEKVDKNNNFVDDDEYDDDDDEEDEFDNRRRDKKGKKKERPKGRQN